MSAADKASQLTQQIDGLREEQRTLVQYASTVLQQQVQGYAHCQGSPAVDSSAPLGQQIEALKLLVVTQQYAAQLRQAAQGIRSLQQVIHSTQRSAQDPEELVKQTAACAASYASCKASISSLAAAEHPAAAVPPSLRACEAQLEQQLQAALATLRQQLSQQIHGYLAQCGWPPPITSASPAAADTEGPGGPGNAFDPSTLFTPGHGHDIAQLQRLLVALTGLQQAEDKAALDALAQGGDTTVAAPILWAAQELAAPLSDKLLHHFANEMPPGAVERPQWLLNTVLRLCREYAPRLEFLQGVVQACDLHSCYNFSVEFSRALRATAKQLLRDTKLPAVAAAGDARLWLHYADCLSKFDEQLGPLLGLMVPAGAPMMPEGLVADGVMSVMAENSSCMDAWLGAEATTAAGKVDKLLYSASCWDKAPSLVAEDAPPWQCELYPPAGAEMLVVEVESLLERIRYIPQHAARDRFLQEVVGTMLQQAHGRIVRMLQQAELFKDVGGLAWVPKVCVCICFCHYVEVHLQELQEQLQLQLSHQGHTTPRSSHAGGGLVGNSSSWSPGAPLQQPASAVGSEPTANGTGAKEAPLQLLKRPLAEFAATRKEWVYKVAKAAGQGFAANAAGYMSRESLFKDGGGGSEGCVSGPLLDGLAWLQHVLAMLADHLDSRCFRDTWRAIAATLNRELFNNVATEMVFSRAGAAQLSTDVAALLSCFAPWTPKPQSHFKELLEATRLLGLEQGQVAALQQLVNPASRSEASLEQARRLLAGLGVVHLEADHVDTILSLRL